jgi:cyclophilin family peptidyl-prolyl cis-trans isomerase
MRRRLFLLTSPLTTPTGLGALLGLGSLSVTALAGCGPQSGGATAAPSGTPAAAGKTAVIELEKGGSITLQLFPAAAPKTVQNFEDKASKGFYNGLIFHRVEDWVVQGGDPTGTGTGGANSLPTEVSDRPFGVGSLGVARRSDAPDRSNDSQFFICTKPADWLNKQYTNFGQVTAGMDTVRTIQRGDKIKRIAVQG